MKSRLIVVLLALCTIAVAADTCNTGPKFIDLQANPSKHYGFTLFCDGAGGRVWAIAIADGDWRQNAKGEKYIADAYMVEHKYCTLEDATCADHQSIRAGHAPKPYCIETESHGTQCLKVTYGKVWEDQDGTEHAQVKLRGIEK